MTKTLHWVAMTGVLTAVMVVARLFVHPWPNVTPFTALVILVAWYFGWRIALPAASLAVILTGLLLGMHPVVMVQLILYAGLVALLSRLWTGFFDTARCRYTEKFSKPRFQPKMA